MDDSLQNAYMLALFGSFGIQSISNGGKSIRNVYGNPNFLRGNKLFFPSLYRVHNLYILMDFYLDKSGGGEFVQRPLNPIAVQEHRVL
jgi:hypothetical protein